MAIVVENISKHYGAQKALDNISFTIDDGKIVGLLGPNGAGKSTLMKIITGYVKPTNGKTWVNGLDAVVYPLAAKRQIGYLPENNPLYLDLYIKEYLYFVAGIHQLGKAKKGRIDEIIEMTGLAPEINKKIGALSKGYRQRVGLAQALIHDPGVLLLDEPTSGLDPNQIAEIRDLISTIGKEKTVMLSTHIMQEVEAICERIIIIDKGKMVADNTPDKIQEQSGGGFSTIFVEFDKKPDTQKLENLDGILKTKEISPCVLLVQSQLEKDIRPVIFQFAVQNGLTVLSMQKKEKSLEEVFRELTGGN